MQAIFFHGTAGAALLDIYGRVFGGFVANF